MYCLGSNLISELTMDLDHDSTPYLGFDLFPDLVCTWVYDLGSDLFPDLVPDLVSNLTPDAVLDLTLDLTQNLTLDLAPNWVIDLVCYRVHLVALIV